MCVSSLPRLAFDGLERDKITVSLSSSKASSTILAIVIFPEVLPAGIVNVPLARV